MKLGQASKLLLLASVCDAFAPAKLGARPNTARSLGIDHSSLQDLPHHVQSLQEAFSTVSLSDAFDSIPEPAAVVDAAAEVAEKGSGNGWFGFLTGPIESLLQIIHSMLVGVGIDNTWGVSIIVMTLVIKLATFPLTKTQLESTNKMQVSFLVYLVILFFSSLLLSIIFYFPGIATKDQGDPSKISK